MKKISLGYDLTCETFSWAWHHKKLFWYVVLIAAAKYLFEGLVGLRAFNALAAQSLFVIKAVGVFFEKIIAVFIFAALINRFYTLFIHKKMDFFESFHFNKGVPIKLLVWAFILAVAAFIKKYFIISSGLNFNYEQGLQVQIVYSEVLIWLLSLIISLILTLVAFYVIPILIKKNKSLWMTIKEALAFVWNNLLVTIFAQFVYWIFFCALFLALGLIVIFIMWIISLIAGWLNFPIPFGSAWIVPVVLIMIVPVILLVFYFGIVQGILPALLYLKLSKK